MKLIAVTQRVVLEPRAGERRDALDQRWSEFLAACGACPVPVPNRASSALVLAAAVRPAGLLLTGGNSLLACGGDAPERDATELALLEWALKAEVPVLGVCRGMQVIQHKFGVPLRQVRGHVNAQQTIQIHGREQQVNSYHDWGTTETVPELVVWARAEDGVIKGIRHMRQTIQGIMWHPERLQPFRAADLDWMREIFRLP